MSDRVEIDKREIMSALQVESEPGRTYLVAVAIDLGDANNPPRNTQFAVRCHKGEAFATGYAYDQGSDSYLVNCVASLMMGHVPVAYSLTMPATGNWRVRIPIPEALVAHYLSAMQKDQLNQWAASYQSPRYSIQIMQMSGCEV